MLSSVDKHKPESMILMSAFQVTPTCFYKPLHSDLDLAVLITPYLFLQTPSLIPSSRCSTNHLPVYHHPLYDFNQTVPVIFLPVSISRFSMTCITLFQSTPVSRTASIIGCCVSATFSWLTVKPQI